MDILMDCIINHYSFFKGKLNNIQDPFEKRTEKETLSLIYPYVKRVTYMKQCIGCDLILSSFRSSVCSGNRTTIYDKEVEAITQTVTQASSTYAMPGTLHRKFWKFPNKTRQKKLKLLSRGTSVTRGKETGFLLKHFHITCSLETWKRCLQFKILCCFLRKEL